MRFLSLLLVAFCGLLSSVGAVQNPTYIPASQAAKDILNKHKNIVVFFFENQSYDYLFATFEGGHGLDAATLASLPPQIDRDGKIYEFLEPGSMKAYLPGKLPNAPFEVSNYVEIDETTPFHGGVPTHVFHNEQAQINNGRMDRFVAWSSVGSYTMAHYDLRGTWLFEFAKNWTLFDRFHHSAFGGSHLNHHFLIRPYPPVAVPPVNPTMITYEDSRGYPTGSSIYSSFSSVYTTEMYVVGTAWNLKMPCYDPGAPQLNLPLDQTTRTIGHTMADAGISWVWYAEMLDEYFADPHAEEVWLFFANHHHPFSYYVPWNDPQTQAFHDKHKDERQFFAALAADTLPQVSYVKPSAKYDFHAGQNNVVAGMTKMKQYADAVLASPSWKRGELLVIITFDENGGHWDHVAPYKGDKFGPGTRIPAIVMSPHYKKNFVNHAPYETLSIMRLIQTRFGLVDYLAQTNPTRAATVPDLTWIFDQTDNSWDPPTPGPIKAGPVALSCPSCPVSCGACVCNPVTCPATPSCPNDNTDSQNSVNVNFANMFSGFNKAV